VLDLAGGGPGPAEEVARHLLAAEGLSVSHPGDAGAVLDARAKAAYRQRLADLREEIEDAERMHDPERAAKARDEHDFIAQELSAAVGLGGQDRKAASAAERARVNVTRTIRQAIDRVRANSPALGEHLAVSVHTGTFCSYRPDPHAAVTWSL
jgi:hypothetical protein